MRASLTSFSKKLVSTFFAATLALGLVPAAAFAVPAQDGPASADSADAAMAEVQDESFVLEDQETSGESGAHDSTTDESQNEPVDDALASSTEEIAIEEDAATSDDSQVTVPAAGVINQTMPLEVVAQQESTRSYFLAQTLESTKTVPIVSANLPLDKGTDKGPQAGADGGTAVGSEDEVVDSDPSVSTEGKGSSEDEGDDDSDESDLGTSDSDTATPGVSGESTVVGSFTYLGMTFAVEPGGETVALVAVDYSKLPEEFVQKQILVVPDAATPDGVDCYSVTRIAANAFSSLTKENANPDHTGCIELFSDEELLAEAGISQEEVQELLSAEPAESNDLEPSDGIRTIVSMDGSVATLDDGSTYTFANPLEGCAGILALGIPASVTSIEDDAFAGFDTLQYLVVSEDNPEYASFDGALYSADLTNLRLIPEGRVGAVRVAPSATGADPEVFSHCPSVDALVADAEGESNRLLQGYGGNYEGNRIAGVVDGIPSRLHVLDLLACGELMNVEERYLMEPMLLPGDVAPEERATNYAGAALNVIAYRNGTVYWSWNSRFSASGVNGVTMTTDLTSTRPTLDQFELISYEKGNAYSVHVNLSSSPGGTNLIFGSSPVSTQLSGGVLFNTVVYTSGSRQNPTMLGSDYVNKMTPGSGTFKFWLDRYTGGNSGTAISEFYDPGAGGWKYNSDGSISTQAKSINHVGQNVGAATVDVTVQDAPSIAPAANKAFVGWKCSNGRTYQPGDIIENSNNWLFFDAIWVDAYKVTWDASIFGDSIGSAALVSRDKSFTASNPNNILTNDAPAATVVEQVKITDVSDPDHLAGTTTLPAVADPVPASGNASDLEFVGWTTAEANGAPAKWSYDAAKQAFYLDADNGTLQYLKPASEDDQVKLIIDKDITLCPVWKTTVKFSAPSYGGKIVGDADGATDEVTVFNNQPVPVELVPAVGVDEAGAFVPEQFNLNGFNEDRWRFVGWSTEANPNVSESGDVGGDTANLAAADVIGSDGLVPDGATTYHAVWECGISWVKDPNAAPEVTTAYDVAYPAGESASTVKWYLYGYDLATPGLTTDASGNIAPASHGFSAWKDNLGNAAAPSGEANATHTVLTGGPVTAYWAPNERVVTLSGNGAASQDQRTYAVYDESMPLRKANAAGDGLDYTGVGWLAVPQREGYEFAGYWNTRYTEDTSRIEDGVPLTSGGAIDAVVPKQYYGTDAAGNLTSLAAWDITNNDQQLFAHWRYKVVLNLNVFNADGEAVLADAVDDDGNLIPRALYSFAAAPKALPTAAGAAYTEQSAIESDAEASVHGVLGEGTRPIVVQGDTSAAGKAGYTNLAYERFVFTAIDGAPIQLPGVGGREGYQDTSAWTMLAAGSSSEALLLDGNGVTQGASFHPVLVDTAGGITSAAGSATGKACVVAADWSGKAKRYKVTLQSTYTHDGTGHSLKGMPETQTIYAVYDQPLLLANAPNITPTAAAPAYVNQDSLRDNPTNLVFQGFYTRTNGAFTANDGASPEGKRYIMAGTAVEDPTERTAVTATEEYGVSSAVRSVRFREASAGTEGEFETATLYALWGYPRVTVSFDYQGGTSADFASGAAAPEVTRDLTTLDVMPTGLAVPTRTGYKFNGFWTTKHSEADASAQYYTADMQPTAAHATLQSTVNLPLYAHWTYYVQFDKNLPSTDKAQLDTSFAATDTTMVNATASLLANPPVSGTAPDYTDAAGNRFFESTDSNGMKTITIEAIAGAPIELKAVHERTLLDGTPTGYDSTASFTTRKDDTAARVATTLVNGKPTTAEYAARSAYPTPITYLTGGTAGNVEGGTGVNDPYVVTLWADWSDSKQDFWVQLTYSYSGDVLDTATQAPTETAVYEACVEDGHESGHTKFADPAPFTVTYDEPVVAAGATLAANQITRHAFSEVTLAGAAESETHANLDLLGIFAADRNEAGHVTAFRSKYVDASGASSNATDCDLAFREYYLPAKVNAGDSEALQQQARANAVKLFAKWAEPTRAVLFNYYDNTLTANSSASEAGNADAMTLQKGDRVADAAPAAALRAIAERVKDVDNQQDAAQDKRYNTYEFAGFWTHPFYEGAYDADGDGVDDGFSKQYFAMDAAGASLQAVSANTADDPQRAVWEEDRTTTLYAHWKYTIDVTTNPLRPEATGANWSGGSDMLYFVSAGGSVENDSAETHTVKKVTYGDETFIQHDPALIQRTRDFDLTAGRDIRRTGYLFDGWYEGYSEADGFARPVAYLDAEQDGLNAKTDTRTLTPGTDKKVTLRAKWTQEEYTVDLVASNAGSAYPDFYYNGQVQTIANEGFRTRQVTVCYDEPLPGGITAPDMTGYQFLGYATDQQTAAPSMNGGTYQYATDWPTRVLFYSGSGMVDGNVIPSAADEPWVLAGEVPAAKQTAKLYAHYDQKVYDIRFNLIHSADQEKSLEKPVSTADFAKDANRSWHYGKPLGSSDLPVPSSFERYGYEFAGWYLYPAGTTDFTDAARVFLSDARGDIVLNVQRQWLLDQGADLYAAWKPLTYTVDFYYNVPDAPTAIRPSVSIANIAYETDLVASAVENPNALAAGEVPNVTHAPYAFAGWNTVRGTMENGDNTGFWLLSNLDVYDNNVTDEQHRLKRAGRFMPQASSVTTTVDGERHVSYYAQWHPLDDEFLLLFPGNHGWFSSGYTQTGQLATNVSNPGSVVLRRLNNVYGESVDLTISNLGLGLNVDDGWQLRGWMKVPADELPANATKDGSALAQTSEAAAVNARERTDDHGDFVPNSFDCMNNGDVIPFATYYLVAVYAQDGDLAITLDKNVPADVSVTLGPWATTGSSYAFELYRQQPDGSYQKHENIALPTAARKGYTFAGWERYQVDENGQIVYEKGPNGGPDVPKVVERLAAGEAVDLDAWAAESHSGTVHRTRMYYATWEADAFTIELCINREDDAAVSETVQVVYDDANGFELPYPASKMVGGFFSGYDVVPAGTGYATTMFYPEDMRPAGSEPYTLNALYDVVYGRALTASDRELYQSELADNVIKLYAQWNYTVSATMPVQVLIKVDPDTGDMITAPLQVSGGAVLTPSQVGETAAGQAGSEAASNNPSGGLGAYPLEVVNLRYERPSAQGVFDIGSDVSGGKASLSVYADQTGLDFTRSGNVKPTGDVVSTTGDGTETVDYRPLKIDLSEDDQVIGVDTLRSYGFREFWGAGGVLPNNLLPLHYGVVFEGTYSDGGQTHALDAMYFVKCGQLDAVARDTDKATPIAHLYYTVKLA